MTPVSRNYPIKASDLLFGLMASLDKPEYRFSDLMYLTGPFNISETNIRTALSRFVAKGVLSVRKEGKRGYYRFSEKGERVRNNIALTFKSVDWSGWDGRWWGLAYSVPGLDQSERYRIRKKIEAYRFAALYGGFWIRPKHEKDRMAERLADLVAHPCCHMIRFDCTKAIANEDVNRLWQLERVHREFERGLKLLEERDHDLHSLNPERAFVEQMNLGGEIVQILAQDPILPELYLPENWQGARLKQKFRDWLEKAHTRSRSFWNKIFTGGSVQT